ncbi:hypothetical protein BpHYR1_016765 [Brachionus plicatilis]|uniref:Uncharacterized protein n=1 Tax=Brachionus plicatilis TaxID=10195 RepID=A0A3M7SNG3_BRAPC|nr:hypothetical protein BpHYR1_016765 [Brachionus plicatilis]
MENHENNHANVKYCTATINCFYEILRDFPKFPKNYKVKMKIEKKNYEIYRKKKENSVFRFNSEVSLNGSSPKCEHFVHIISGHIFGDQNR